MADALQKAQTQAQQEQATRDAAKAEYEKELAEVRVADWLFHLTFDFDAESK